MDWQNVTQHFTDLNRLAQYATVGAFVIALLAALLAVLGRLGQFLGWMFRGFRPKPQEPMRVIIDPPADQPAPAPPPAPPPRGPRIGLPTLGRAVRGRDEMVAALHLGLTEKGEAATVNRAVVRGQGGLGKTTLALHYVDRYGGEYYGILWAVAETELDLAGSITALASHLGTDISNLAPLQAAQAVLGDLSRDDRTWLLVYDNAADFDAIRRLVPHGEPVHLIVTTRESEGWDAWVRVAPDTLPFDTVDGDAVRVLMEAAGRTDDAAGARALAEDLGGLPLALVVAGSLIRDTGESFDDYRHRLDEIIKTGRRGRNYEDSVVVAVQLSYDQLSDDARMVVDLFAWWSPDGLDGALLTDAPEGDWWSGYESDIPDDVQALTRDPSRVRAVLRELLARSLLEREGDDHALHRMSAAALRALQADRGDEATASAAAALLVAVYPTGDKSPEHSPQWPHCRRLTPHVRALWATGAAPTTEAMESLLNQSFSYLDAMADYAGSVEFARASLDRKCARLPEAHRDVALAHGNLGVALMRLGDFAAADGEISRAIALDEKHRPRTEELAGSYDQHGHVLVGLGRAGAREALVRALRRFQQALALRRHLFARDSHQVASTQNNIGATRDDLGQKRAALRLYRAALSIYERILNLDDARLSYGYLNVGGTWIELGRADEGEPLLRDALAPPAESLQSQPATPRHAQRRGLARPLPARQGAGWGGRGGAAGGGAPPLRRVRSRLRRAGALRRAHHLYPGRRPRGLTPRPVATPNRGVGGPNPGGCP